MTWTIGSYTSNFHVRNKSLVSCENKRSYHVFHVKLVILFFMWKKKKKKKQSIFLFLSWWNKRKTIMNRLSFHSHGSNPSFSFIWENKFYVSSCGKQRLWRRRNNPSFSHCGKQSSVPCGSNNKRRNNHVFFFHAETIFFLMWK